MKMKQTECRNPKIHLAPSIQTCACFFVQLCIQTVSDLRMGSVPEPFI